MTKSQERSNHWQTIMLFEKPKEKKLLRQQVHLRQNNDCTHYVISFQSWIHYNLDTIWIKNESRLYRVNGAYG